VIAFLAMLPFGASPSDLRPLDNTIVQRIQAPSIGGSGGAGGNANVIIGPGNTIYLTPQGGAGGNGGAAIGGPGPGPMGGADAVQTVRSFYAAVARADGIMASNFVVPEKRSSGPLSAGAISGFYSQLPRPLSLIDVQEGNNGSVQARYQFTRPNGTVCDGRATVNTVRASGQTFIYSIKANC
jgi:hypothetical protein